MKSVAMRFAAAASTYCQAADIQEQVAAKLMEYIPSDIHPERILEVGCGTGFLTARLRRRFPDSRLCALDLAPAMLAEARRHLPDSAIEWMTGDLRNMPAGPGYQLLASSASLHWLQPIIKGFAAVRRQMTFGGRLVCAIMLDGTLRELHQLRRRIVPDKQPVVRLPETAELLQALTANGLQRMRLEVAELETRHASADDLLRRLHDQGVTAGPLAGAQRPLVRGELQRLTAAYDAMFDGGAVTATYRVAYLMAVKK